MAHYLDPFELRRLVVKFNRPISGGVGEDQAMVTFHFAKLTAGVPDAAWVTADYTAVEARFDTWWTAQKVDYNPGVSLAEYRWYKDGPVWSPADRANGPPNPAERVTARTVPGTNASGAMLPPQVAWTFTEKTELRKRWGRGYMPPVSAGSGISDVNGRIAGSVVTTWLGRLVALYNGCRADGKQPVVFSRGLSAHLDAHGGTIPAHTATAYEVLSLQVDNLWDVMRSRRYGGPTQRSETVLT